MSGAPSEIVRSAELAHLPAFLDFVAEACARTGADTSAAFALKLAVEEVVTNVIVHGYEGLPPGPVSLAVSEEPGRIVFTISDHARPFHPDDAPAPDLSSPWAERRVGGLGWHLIRELMDEVRYESTERGNRLTLVKMLGAGTADNRGARGK